MERADAAAALERKVIGIDDRFKSRNAAKEEFFETRATLAHGIDLRQIGPELRDVATSLDPGGARRIGEDGLEDQMQSIVEIRGFLREDHPVLPAIRAVRRSEIEAVDQRDRHKDPAGKWIRRC